MISKDRADQIFGGVFLIGLALLFFTGNWWPGIMFVIGIAMLARTYAEGKPLTSNGGAWVTLAIGAVFALGDVFQFLGDIPWWPLILIALGLFLLFGQRRSSDVSIDNSDKSKREDL
ncbi:MAG: hypothetical protein KJ065_25950 [Anaerolineae bacterium]|nr:hypothetical protein [Anaerolineae bacterium]